LNSLVSLSDSVEPLIKNSQILNIKIKYENKYSINFRDSYLLLPSKLKDLSENFNVYNPKNFFPLKFVSEKKFGYEGIVPGIEIFYKISQSDYNKYVSKFNKRISI
jgi:hypothetical protein